MTQLEQLKEEKRAKLLEMEALLEGESISDENYDTFKALKGEVATLDEKIAKAEEVEEAQRQIAQAKAKRTVSAPKKSPEQKAREAFSITRAIKIGAGWEKLDGVEAEMHEEAIKEAREAGTQVSNIGVPSFMMDFGNKRDLTVGTATEGGNTVATDLGALIPALRPRPMVVALGATTLTGLVGNLDLPKHTTLISATWEGEQDAAAQSDPAFGKISLTPNRLAAFTEFSSQLRYQSSIGIENFVRQELADSIARGLDSAAINGSGTGSEPEGLLNMSAGINTVAIATDGGAPTRAHIIDMETQIATDNADVMNMAYLTTPGVRGKLKNTATDAGSGLFVWQSNADGLNGYRAEVSTQVPSNLTKGVGTNLHGILFGNWRELILGQWGGMDIIVNPYTQAKNATVEVVVNTFWDIQARHQESFSIIVDADIS